MLSFKPERDRHGHAQEIPDFGKRRERWGRHRRSSLNERRRDRGEHCVMVPPGSLRSDMGVGCALLAKHPANQPPEGAQPFQQRTGRCIGHASEDKKTGRPVLMKRTQQC